MSKLSMLDEVITSHKEICKCGLIITREQDKANGICRKCNPYSLPEKKQYYSSHINGRDYINITGNPEFSR